jgi:uncharacterized protein with GYD domain
MTNGTDSLTFVLLSTLTANGSQRLAAQPDRMYEVNQEIEELGCHVVGQYALIGPFDFITIVETPDVATAAVLSAVLNSRGAIRVLAMPALVNSDFVGHMKSSAGLAKRLPMRSRDAT